MDKVIEEIKERANQRAFTETLSDGTVRRFYQNGVLKMENTPDGTRKEFYPNGSLASCARSDGTITCYFQNGKISYKKCQDSAVQFVDTGAKLYEISKDKVEINPKYHSFFRIGFKTLDNDQHWTNTCTLDPDQKTVLCLGGDQTRDERSANGNINAFLPVLGLSTAEEGRLQKCSGYRPVDICISHTLFEYQGKEGRQKQCYKDYRREVLKAFLPFMAHVQNGQFMPYSAEELSRNFRNILIETHCYGTQDLLHIRDVFKNTMAQLGYDEKTQKHALSQIIVLSNNTQLETTEDLGFTCLHRYSVTDGQTEADYDEKYSDALPVFLEKHKKFAKHEGKSAAFIQTNPHEMLLAFDRVLKPNTGSEHNDGFWTTKQDLLTPVGQAQADLIQAFGHWWVNNREEVPQPKEILKRCATRAMMSEFVNQALENGQTIAAERKNPLKNKHILKKARNKLNDGVFDPNDDLFLKRLTGRTAEQKILLYHGFRNKADVSVQNGVVPPLAKGKGVGGQADGFYVWNNRAKTCEYLDGRNCSAPQICTIEIERRELTYPNWQLDYEALGNLDEKDFDKQKAFKNRLADMFVRYLDDVPNYRQDLAQGKNGFEITRVAHPDENTIINITAVERLTRLKLYEGSVATAGFEQVLNDYMCARSAGYRKEYNQLLIDSLARHNVALKYTGDQPLRVVTLEPRHALRPNFSQNRPTFEK